MQQDESHRILLQAGDGAVHDSFPLPMEKGLSSQGVGARLEDRTCN
jgi:hypothetical protein